MTKRVFLIVLDSFGVGELPDANDFGDVGSNTLGAVKNSRYFDCKTLTSLGLFNIDGVGNGTNNPKGSYAKMTELSKGKDTTVGHWEIAGVVSDKPLPTYPNGFPEEVINAFEYLTDKKVICNKPYSGTEVIKDYGQESIDKGALIVYTSADSVFQVASHIDHISLDELYRYCEIARRILTGKHGVGRVIARPFTGEYPFVRTADRHDYSIEPPKTTMLDVLNENGYDVISVGKIIDIFAGRGITESYRIKSNNDGMDVAEKLLDKDFTGLCFVNLVDFDTIYGHRNDIDGYAKALTEFDNRLASFISKMRDDDVLIITADHGCDPSTPSTDHSREYTPMIIYGNNILEGVNLGTRDSFADIASTILSLFSLESGVISGNSFIDKVIKKGSVTSLG